MDNINIVNASHSKTGAAVAASNTGVSQEGQGGIGESDPYDSAGSFHSSIKKAYDSATQSEKRVEKEQADDELSGNNMPASSVPTEIDDHAATQNNFSVAGNVPAEDRLSAQKEILRSQLSLSSAENVSNPGVEISPLSSQLAIDKNIVSDGEANVLAAQINPLLKKQVGTVSTTVDGLKKMVSATEKIAIGSEAMSTLDAEQLELMTAKNQLLTNTSVTNTALLNSASLNTASLNTSAQQQTLPNLQTSLLQTASAQITTDVEGLATIANTPTNSLSAINLQAMTQAEITPALGRPAWSQAMGKQVMMMVNQNIGVAEIRLNPAHLGPIEILIDMSDEQVSVSMSSRHAVVREAMEQALPKLREMLDEKGFSLADTDISKHSFAEQREQNAENNKTGINRGANDELLASGVSEQVIQQVSLPAGMVDYYI